MIKGNYLFIALHVQENKVKEIKFINTSKQPILSTTTII